tara:strand:- start:1399 stop:1614 length:216 start_codon:yes stop_codon:yes gene_type:complete
LAPYSPILFGVINDNVSEAKLCFVASSQEFFLTLLINIFYLAISTKWLIIVKKSKKTMFFDKKTSKSINFE